MLKTERGGKKTNFRIGDGFLSEWNINEDREEPMSKIMMTLTAAWLSIKALFLKMTGYFKKGKSDNHGDH